MNKHYISNSFFQSGVEVHIQCRFRATSPKTSEQISFSVNRTTDQYGMYRLDIPSVDGVNCVEGSAIVSLCQASLIGSSSSSCNVPFIKSTASEISVKSKQDHLCIYTLSGLSYKPPQKNTTLCGTTSTSTLESSKFYFPYLPPYGFPPFPSIPLPPITPFPSSIPFPSLPFPFPSLPPLPPTPPSHFFPPLSPPFNLGDPTTWVPHIPSLSHPPPPPPPAFNLGDPRTWIPHVSPSPPQIPQNQNP